jgi:spore coat polysaccharide biosynthesis predicted glycosyltransferase SpsG
MLIGFGGDDAHGLARRAAGVVARAFPRVQVDVLGGFVAGDAEVTLPNIRWHSSPDVAALMASADLAVVAAGSTCWELAFMGVPAVVMIVAGNQQGIARGLHERGIVRSLGWHTEVDDDRLLAAVDALCADAEARRLMSERGRQLVDGLGAARVVKEMRA